MLGYPCTCTVESSGGSRGGAATGKDRENYCLLGFLKGIIKYLKQMHQMVYSLTV